MKERIGSNHRWVKKIKNIMVKYGEIKLESVQQQLADIFHYAFGHCFWISSDLCLWVSGQRGSVGNLRQVPVVCPRAPRSSTPQAAVDGKHLCW